MHIKMDNKKKHFDRNKIRKLLEDEDEYISNLLAVMDVPDSVHDDNIDDLFLKNTKKLQHTKLQPNAQRAQTADDLQQRLEIMKNKMKSKKSKPSERTLKKRELKKLKKNKEFKKRIISVAKSNKNEQIKEEKFLEDNKDNIKPVYNADGKITFSKFEFAARASKAKKSKKDKIQTNPKIILQTIKKQKKEMNELIEKGDTEKAAEIKENLAWKKAFDKIDGKKVKDDTSLLHKTIKRRKITKTKSKAVWKQREENVEKKISDKQKKRQENINKKKEEKRKHKLKKMSNRGRIIPGY